MSYKTDLDNIFLKYASSPLLDGELNDRGKCILLVTAQEMKIKYPGNYTVDLCFQSHRDIWGPRLKFDDSQEETMFLLRYS